MPGDIVILQCAGELAIAWYTGFNGHQPGPGAEHARAIGRIDHDYVEDCKASGIHVWGVVIDVFDGVYDSAHTESTSAPA